MVRIGITIEASQTSGLGNEDSDLAIVDANAPVYLAAGQGTPNLAEAQFFETADLNIIRMFHWLSHYSHHLSTTSTFVFRTAIISCYNFTADDHHDKERLQGVQRNRRDEAVRETARGLHALRRHLPVPSCLRRSDMQLRR